MSTSHWCDNHLGSDLSQSEALGTTEMRKFDGVTAAALCCELNNVQLVMRQVCRLSAVIQ